jgi:nucleotide-binding universal stress UspA family protein
LLAFISAASEGSISAVFWIRMTLSIAAFSFLILWGVPKLSIWFFKNLEGESGSHYIFVLAMLFISGLLSRAAGIEPIIGAFLAGLAMSNVIPHTSALMNRISFIGNNFFIPIFLISVGLMVDFTVFFTGFGALVFAVSLVIVAISSKYVAAWLTQIIYKYSSTERQVIFGMSVSHAAAIIAVVIVGYNLKLIGLDVLNGAIMIILVSCFIGSFVTEKYGRKLAIIETDKVPAKISSPEQILVSVSNPATIEGLIDFALLIREKKASQPMYMLSVVPDDDFAEDQIVKNNKMFQSAISHAAAAETELSLVSRVDINVANGISRAVKELMVNKIVLGWNGKSTTTNFFFGSIIENLISNSEQMVLVVKITNTLNSLKRIIVVIPENAEREAGFENWVSTLKILSSRTSSSLLFVGFEKSLASIRKFLDIKSDSGNIVFQTTKSTHPIIEQTQIINEMDLLIVISARRRTLSFSHYLDHMPRDMARYFEKNSFIIIYPEQRIVKTQTLSSSLDGIEVSPIQENIDRFSHIGNFKRKSPDTRHNSITE